MARSTRARAAVAGMLAIIVACSSTPDRSEGTTSSDTGPSSSILTPTDPADETGPGSVTGAAEAGEPAATPFGGCRLFEGQIFTATGIPFIPFEELFVLDLLWLDIRPESITSDPSSDADDRFEAPVVLIGDDLRGARQVSFTTAVEASEAQPDPGTRTVESLTLDGPTASDLRSELGPGDRVLVGAELAASDTATWVGRIAMIQRGDDALVAGHCGFKDQYYLERFAEARASTPGASIIVLLDDLQLRRNWHDALVDELVPRAPPKPWIERDPRSRTLAGGQIPEEVLARLDVAGVRHILPEPWRSIEGNICTWTNDGWNEDCFALADGEGWDELSMQSYVTRAGQLEVWLRLQDGPSILLGTVDHAELVRLDVLETDDGRILREVVVRLSDTYPATADLVAALETGEPDAGATFDLAPHELYP